MEDDLIYLDDIEAGRSFVTSRRTITTADLGWFSVISGDYRPLHTDEAFIRERTGFRDRIAQDWLVIAVHSGLRSELSRWQVVAALQCDRYFHTAAYPGDTLWGRYTVDAVRHSESKPGCGIVEVAVEVLREEGEVIQTGVDVMLVAARKSCD